MGERTKAIYFPIVLALAIGTLSAPTVTVSAADFGGSPHLLHFSAAVYDHECSRMYVGQEEKS